MDKGCWHSKGTEGGRCLNKYGTTTAPWIEYRENALIGRAVCWLNEFSPKRGFLGLKFGQQGIGVQHPNPRPQSYLSMAVGWARLWPGHFRNHPFRNCRASCSTGVVVVLLPHTVPQGCREGVLVDIRPMARHCNMHSFHLAAFRFPLPILVSPSTHTLLDQPFTCTTTLGQLNCTTRLIIKFVLGKFQLIHFQN